MEFCETPLAGVYEVVSEVHGDRRGGFSRLYCPQEFAAAGIAFASTQVNLSTNPHALTLRGMHFQDPPFAEAKLVRAVRGRAFDVVIDLRTESSTYCHWTHVELSPEKRNAVFIPEGCAHGFLTLENNTEILYQMGRPYTPGKAKGVRWNDALFNIAWPSEPRIIGDADLAWPDFEKPAP